ncbi:hypothetical protein Barb6_02364 [Bacteroidales bacterium Barb6]|nr:hypothetical protein Barb6_02364 [Bacteroidales bacterium Barb6]OAV71810.1 hypothetical protein Barb4_00417 [Bacteroidales bacterium Barb4]
MGTLSEKCDLIALNEEIIKLFSEFKCSNEDLDDFFANESYDYQKQLIGKTYCFVLKENPNVIVCAFTVSNAGMSVGNLPNSRKKKITKNIPYGKHFNNYPAVLIGRIGVSESYKKQNIGTELLFFIKSWFISPDNKTGCRFIAVDAYNELGVLKFYEKNGFKYLFSSLEQEREEMRNNDLNTRYMYFDLIELFGL